MKPLFQVLLLSFLAATSLQAQSDFWVPAGGPDEARVASIVVASNGDLFAGTIGTGVFRSTNSGESWVPVNTGLTQFDIHTLSATNGDRLYAGTASGFVYYSDNLGETWNLTDSTGIYDIYAVGFTPAGQLFASGFGGICRSTNSGSSWDQLDVGMPQIMIWSTVLILDENTLITGSLGMGAIRSTTAGTTWEQIFPGPPDNIIYSFFRDLNDDIFAATGMGIYKSLDNGVTWSEIPDPENSDVSLFVLDPSNRYVAVTSGGAYVSTDGGTLWSGANSGLGDLQILSLAVADDGAIYAGTDGGGVYVNQVATSVELSENIPGDFTLEQNYPNPFNPSTSIGFHLPAGQAGITDIGFVSLQVYDLLGREVATLVNETLVPGSYIRHWDAAGVTSGVYYYRLQAGNSVQSKRMVLMR